MVEELQNSEQALLAERAEQAARQRRQTEFVSWSSLVVQLALLGLHLLPRVLILMHCFAMARYFGVEGLSSIAVALLPLVVEVAVGMVVGVGAEALLPKPLGKP